MSSTKVSIALLASSFFSSIFRYSFFIVSTTGLTTNLMADVVAGQDYKGHLPREALPSSAVHNAVKSSENAYEGIYGSSSSEGLNADGVYFSNPATGITEWDSQMRELQTIEEEVRAARKIYQLNPQADSKKSDKMWRSEKERAQLHFKDALDRFYKQHPALLSARMEIRKAYEDLKKAKVSIFPNVSFSYGFTPNATVSEVLPNSTIYAKASQFNDSLTLNIPLLNGKSSIHDIASAQYALLAAIANYNKTEQETASKAIEAYVTCAAAFLTFESAKSNLQAVIEAYLIAKMKADLGETAMVELNRAIAEFYDAKAKAQQAEGNLQSAQGNYDSFFKFQGKQVKYPRHLPEIRFNTKLTPGSLINTAITHNPGLLYNKYMMMVTEKALRNKVTAMLPSIDLSFSRTSQYQRSLTSVANPDQIWEGNPNNSASLSLNWDMQRVLSGKFDAMNLIADRGAKRFSLEAIIQNLKASVHKARSAIFSSEAAVVAMLHQIISLQQTVDALREEFRLGSKDLKDVLDSQTQLYESQQKMIRTKQELIAAIVDMLSTTGKLTPKALGLETKNFDFYKDYKQNRNLFAYKDDPSNKPLKDKTLEGKAMHEKLIEEDEFILSK